MALIVNPGSGSPSSFTNGSIPFALSNALTENNANLRWDDAATTLYVNGVSFTPGKYSAGTGASFVGFVQSGTGAASNLTVQGELRRFVWPEQFGAVGDAVTDDTTAMQNFFNACQNRKGLLLNRRYRITSPLTLDPNFRYDIEGVGFDPNGVVASVIHNAGTGRAITCINGTTNDNLIRLSNFCLLGNGQSSDDGIYFSRVPGARFERLWITTHGGHAIRLERCWTAELNKVTGTQNGKHGLWLDKQCNDVKIIRCVFNGNSRLDGYYNMAIVGTLGNENLGVDIDTCDCSYAGINPFTTVTTAYGLVVQYSHSVKIKGYFENSKTANVYADNTAKSLTFVASYSQDGDVNFNNVDGLVVEANTFTRVTLPTTLTIVGQGNAARTGLRIGRNSYNGGATKVFSGFATERQEQFGSTAPATGTYEVGDIVWRNSPDFGVNLGWVCSAAGTPGTWRPFTVTPAVFGDQGDAAAVLTYLVSYPTNIWASPLTVNRAVTFSATNAVSGAKFRITRRASATGVSTLDVTAATTKSLAAGQWCDVEYDGAAWQITAFGSL